MIPQAVISNTRFGSSRGGGGGVSASRREGGSPGRPGSSPSALGPQPGDPIEGEITLVALDLPAFHHPEHPSFDLWIGMGLLRRLLQPFNQLRGRRKGFRKGSRVFGEGVEEGERSELSMDRAVLELLSDRPGCFGWTFGLDITVEEARDKPDEALDGGERKRDGLTLNRPTLRLRRVRLWHSCRRKGSLSSR